MKLLSLLVISFTSMTLYGMEPTVPASLKVRLAGGTELTFDPPVIQVVSAATREGGLPEAPADYAPSHENNEVWPQTLRLTPLYDETRTHILGHYFRTFQEETLAVTSEDGATRYQPGVDYRFQADWGVIANVDGRMKGKIKATAQAAQQRLDLVQVDAAGKHSVKKGESVWLCPVLPEPDAGCTAVAGVYIAPWRAARNPHYDKDPAVLAGATEYSITAREILPITPRPPVEVLHPAALGKTLAKLRAGEPVKIAFMGDSITLGAESRHWWKEAYDENSRTYRGRVVYGLRKRFPRSKIDVVEAYQGGVTIKYGVEQMPLKVAPERPDLVIAAFGANDVDGKLNAGPNTSREDFGKALANLADATREFGGEILMVTPFTIHPWLRNGAAQRLEGHNEELKAIAAGHGAAVADVHLAFQDLNTRGIPYWSQNHNWTNHPGDFGHQLYAETVLRGFPE